MGDTCVITKVDLNEDTVKPVIVEFENGVVEQGQEKNLLCRMYTDEKKDVHVAAATDNMLYNGVLKPNDSYNTFIAICNKKKTKMRLISVDHVTLAPYFKTDGEKKNRSVEMLDSTTLQLNKQFGSKKIKRKMEQNEKMKVDIDVVKDDLEKTVQHIKVEPKDTEVPKNDENDSAYKPRINRNAKAIEDVYNVDDIVSTDVLNSLSEEVKTILNEPESERNLSNFVVEQIRRLANSKSEKTYITLELLLYVDYLIKFLVRPAKDLQGAKALKLSPNSKIVQEDILKRYTVTTGRSRLRPNAMRDKCLCSILVLSTVACDYKLNLEVVSKEVKIGVKKLQDVSRVLAFVVNNHMAVLKLPLPPPVNRNVTKRKKK